MMVLHAAPKTQPGGVQGALFRTIYQSEGTPTEVKKLPTAKAAKWIKRNISTRTIMMSLNDYYY